MLLHGEASALWIWGQSPSTSFMRIRKYAGSITSSYSNENHVKDCNTYLWCHFADAQSLDVHRELHLARVWRYRRQGTSVLLLRFHLLVHKGGHGQQVLEQVVKLDQSVELQVAVTRLLQRLAGHLYHDL